METFAEVSFSNQWTIFVGGDLRVPPRGRTHRCAPTFIRSVLNATRYQQVTSYFTKFMNKAAYLSHRLRP